jgi:hypothetical protein
MARRKKIKTLKRSSKKSMGKHKMLPLAIGAILGNMVNNVVVRYGQSIPMISSISPIGIGILANYMKSDYSDGIIASSAINLISSLGKQYLPTSVSELIAGEDQYVIQGAESADPLLGADYLYGEMQPMTDELGADQFVVSGASNDPLD